MGAYLELAGLDAGDDDNAFSGLGTRGLLIRWSMQEIRRIATRLARQQIKPAHIIAWSLW